MPGFFGRGKPQTADVNVTLIGLDRLIVLFETILRGQRQIMATMKDYGDQFNAKADALNAGIEDVATAVNELEAKITAHINNGEVSTEVAASLQAGLDKLTAAQDKLATVGADARDNTDEAAQVPGGGDTGGGDTGGGTTEPTP